MTDTPLPLNGESPAAKGGDPMGPDEVDRRLLRSTFLRSLTIQGSWNYRTMLGGGMAFALLPLLRRVRGEKGPALEAALARHCGHFNAHPYLAGLALGAVARLELSGAQPEVVDRFKSAVRGPLGGIGDALVWTGWLPITLLITLAAAWWGLPAMVAVPFFLLLYNVGHLGLRFWAFRVGLEEGAAVGARLKQAALGHRAELLFRTGAALIGVLCGVLLASPHALASASLGWVLLAIVAFGVGLLGGHRVWRPTALTVVSVILILFLVGGSVNENPTVIERTVRIVNPMGLHARPAAELVKLAGRFECEIFFEKDGLEVNGKSIMGVLMLAAERGSALLIRAEGDDAAAAVEAIVDLVDQGFHDVYEEEEEDD